MNNELPDIQQTKDNRKIYIQEAGITDFLVPIKVKLKDSDNEFCDTIANVTCTVDVPEERRGINMSRLPIFINQKPILSLPLMNGYVDEICKISETDSCRLQYEFPYFLTKTAPVSNIPGIVNYEVTFSTNRLPDQQLLNYMRIKVISSTCCPCSKEISEYNAHNQKCHIDLNVAVDGMVWIEDLIDICEQSASCQIFSVLKRPDEKFVTEKMYDNPRFVEDVVREVALRIKDVPHVSTWDITATADESIHMHKAIARLWGYKNSH